MSSYLDNNLISNNLLNNSLTYLFFLTFVAKKCLIISNFDMDISIFLIL